MSFNVKAIFSIRNDPKATIGETYEDLIWHDDNDETKPTKKEFDDAVTVCKSEWDAQEYSRKREAEYPSIKECVHAILDDDLDALQTKRAEIKKKYPKG